MFKFKIISLSPLFLTLSYSLFLFIHHAYEFLFNSLLLFYFFFFFSLFPNTLRFFIFLFFFFFLLLILLLNSFINFSIRMRNHEVHMNDMVKIK